MIRHKKWRIAILKHIDGLVKARMMHLIWISSLIILLDQMPYNKGPCQAASIKNKTMFFFHKTYHFLILHNRVPLIGPKKNRQSTLRHLYAPIV